MDAKLSRVDINQATTKELIQLPGLGRKIAERIIAGRPYTSVDDLGHIQGVRNDLLEQWRAVLFVAPVESPEPVTGNNHPELAPLPIESQASPSAGEEIPSEAPAALEAERSSETEAEAPVIHESTPRAEQAPVIEPEVAAKPTEMPVAAAPVVSKQPSPAVLKRSEAVGCGVVVALLVLILSVGLSLGILQMVNGGLNYAAAGQYAALQRQVDAIGSRASTMEQDVANLRTRLDSMEALGGRVSGLENDTQALRSDLDARAAEIQQLKTQLGQMDGRITQVEQRSQTFSRFLDGLRNLVSGILPNP